TFLVGREKLARRSPTVFEVNDVAAVKEDADFNNFEDEIKEAAEECPSEAIEVEED
ncbi:unnamed protein product, partial [marine sediment metagenome]